MITAFGSSRKKRPLAKPIPNIKERAVRFRGNREAAQFRNLKQIDSYLQNYEGEREDHLPILLEERRYFLDRWFDTEKNIFVALSAIVGLPTIIGAFEIKLPMDGLLSLSLLLIAIVTTLLSFRLSVLRNHIQHYDDQVSIIASSLSYRDKDASRFDWARRYAPKFLTHVHMSLAHLSRRENLYLLIAWMLTAVAQYMI